MRNEIAYPKIVKIKKTKREAKNIKTILFEYDGKNITPGQFLMIWIPGLDEIPMSISYINNKEIGFTFRKVGEATTALYNLKKGDKIGIVRFGSKVEIYLPDNVNVIIKKGDKVKAGQTIGIL